MAPFTMSIIPSEFFFVYPYATDFAFVRVGFSLLGSISPHRTPVIVWLNNSHITMVFENCQQFLSAGFTQTIDCLCTIISYFTF